MKWNQMRGSLAIVGLLGAGFFVACGGDDDDKGGGAGDGDGNGDGDGDIDIGGAGATGDGDGDGDGDCGGEDVEADPLPANVLLVVDTSASMLGTPAGFTDNKWETLVSSLKVALPEVQDLVSLGMKVYPSGDTGSDVCSLETGVEVEIDEGAAAVPLINSLLDDESPEGDTPTAAALAEALAYFQSAAGQALEGDSYVLLATDGGPNCNSDPEIDCTCNQNPDPDNGGDAECGVPEQCTINVSSENAVCGPGWGSCCDEPKLCLDDGGTVAAVTELHDAGIKTIVVGMPGSEAYMDVLDRLAVAGGLPAASSSPKYHKVDDPEGLTTALRDVTQSVIRSCEVQLRMNPPQEDKVNVYLDGEVIPKNDDDGWKYDHTTDPTTIVLTGPTCAAVEEAGVEKITVKFNCQTIVR